MMHMTMQWELRVRHNERFICTHCPGKGENWDTLAGTNSHKCEIGTGYYAHEYIPLRKLQQDTYSVLTAAKTHANNFHLMKLIRPSRGIRVLFPLRRSRVWTDYAVAQLKTVHYLVFLTQNASQFESTRYVWQTVLGGYSTLSPSGTADRQAMAVETDFLWHVG